MIDDDDRNWDQTIRAVQWAINSLQSSTTGVAPSSLLFTYTPRDILQNEVILAIHDEMKVDERNLEALKEKVVRNIEKRQRYQKRCFDARRRQAEIYNIGDFVLVENDLTALGSSKKLMPRYKGPYMVTAVLGNDRYEIQDVPGAPRKQRAAKTVFAADRMKRWCQLNELEFNGDEDESPTADDDNFPSGINELFD